jgi:autophagy-related protein 9
MEKSFLNFKAANPEWVPNDPSGSVYLTKMADLSASYHPHVSPIRGGAAGTTTQKRALAERARRYEQAMQNSLQAAAQRKRTSFNVPPHHSRLAQTQHGKLEPSDILEEEDRASDGGVQSKLGDSFVDDVRTRGGMLIDRGKPYVEQSQNDLEAEDEFVNGGFVGLLHQIYNQRR